MKFIETKIKDVYIIEIDRLTDERGFFARCWCKEEFSRRGLEDSFVQCNMAGNKKRGIVRGMHYQRKPDQEVKIVSCIAGGVYDVAVDLRDGSATFGQWVGVELTAENHRMLYIPKGFAHGYQTLTENATVFYQVSAFYAPQSEAGVRYNDSFFNIQWPIKEIQVSEKDQKWPLY